MLIIFKTISNILDVIIRTYKNDQNKFIKFCFVVSFACFLVSFIGFYSVLIIQIMQGVK